MIPWPYSIAPRRPHLSERDEMKLRRRVRRRARRAKRRQRKGEVRDAL